MPQEEEFEDIIVTFTDDDGKEHYYIQEMVIPVADKRFALLVGLKDDDDLEECEVDEDNVLIAKIVVDENGEDEYIEPTDEEYDQAEEAYNALFDEADE